MMKISYTCSDAVVIDSFLEKLQICCDEHVDTQYYWRKVSRRTNEDIFPGDISNDFFFAV